LDSSKKSHQWWIKLFSLNRYHQRETQAAKDLLFRRLRCLANYENANKALEKARARNKDIIQVKEKDIVILCFKNI